MRDALEEAKRARRVAKVRGFETEQYALFSEVSEHADRLETEIESARESYEGAYAVPDAPSRMKGFPRSIADELERVREPVATVLRVAASMSTFRSAPGNEETDGAKLASATDGRGAKGDGAYLAESMFRGAQPYAFIRAFVEAAKMSLADFPMLAHDALALEGGEDVNLADAVTPLIDSLQSESNVRWLELPKFGSADETVLYAALTRVHNHLVDFRVARLRINTDAVEEGDFDLLLSGPEDAAMEWSFVKQAKGLPTASRQRLKPLDDVIATARAHGRLDTLARQGFIDGETDLDEVMMTLDVSASQVIKNHDAAVAEAKRRSPGSAVAPSHVDAVRRYLAKVNATQQAKDRLAAAQQEGVIPKAIKASSLPKDVISILQNVTVAGIETLNAVLGAEITELERRGSLFFGANQPIADVDALFTDNSKQLAVASAHSDQLAKYASRLEKVGVIGDILSIGTGLYQIATASSRSEVVSGAIDVASGAVGLGLLAASKSSSMTLAAGRGRRRGPRRVYVRLLEDHPRVVGRRLPQLPQRQRRAP